MPADRSRYPDNWEEIATGVKDAADWTCQQCGRPCRKLGVEWPIFSLWLLSKGGAEGWYLESFERDAQGNIIEKPQRFTLTVAHLDQNPANSDPTKLRALCAPCHLNYDRDPVQQVRRQQVNLERRGQMRLFA